MSTMVDKKHADAIKNGGQFFMRMNGRIPRSPVTMLLQQVSQ